VEFTFINQRIHCDSGLPPQISNEFKPFSRTLLPKPSFSRVHYDPMLFLWTCHFVSLLVILWFNLGTFSSYIKYSVACGAHGFCPFLFWCSNSENGTNKVVSFSFHKLLIMFIIDYIFHSCSHALVCLLMVKIY
jgi:hypothetical protein